MWIRMLAPVLVLPILPLWASLTAHAASPTGVWLTDTGKGKVQVSKCGKKLCAKIVWLRDAVDERGRPWTDGYNPDPALRKRQVVGLSTFLEMEKQGPNLWIGSVYSPEEGKVYENIKISLVDQGTLKLEGCRVMGMVCRHKLWSRSKFRSPKTVVAAARQKAKAAPRPRKTVERAPAPPAPARAAVAESWRPLPPEPTTTASLAPIREARLAPPRAIASTAPAPRTASGQGYVVQLAARRTESLAQQAVQKLRRKYPMLGNYEATILRADLGESGVWYRLRFGTMSGRTAAADLCAELIASGLPDCLVRRR